jgi:Leucine-rich repeat (LRR) protein
VLSALPNVVLFFNIRPTHHLESIFKTPQVDRERLRRTRLEARKAVQPPHVSKAVIAEERASPVESYSNLVETLYSIESCRSAWSTLKHLDLNSRSLDSIYGLSDAMPSLQRLDISRNAIRFLSGVPGISCRSLTAHHNGLSTLTSFNHLSNLQTLDVSFNAELHDLGVMAPLIHLRELRADGNNIASLDGLECLCGLISLSLRRNKISTLQLAAFGNGSFDSLERADLAGNLISSLDHLDIYPALKMLGLGMSGPGWAKNADCAVYAILILSFEIPFAADNKIKDIMVDRPVTSLKALYLNGNLLERFDCSLFPNLDIVDLERNKLSDDALMNTGKEFKRLSVFNIARQENKAHDL